MISTTARAPDFAPRDTRQVNLSLPAKVHARLADMAKTAGMPTTTYATNLLMAAYSARCGATGDRDLDAAVARVGVLYATRQLDTATIASAVGLHEQTVVDIIGAWKAELAA